MFELKPFYKTLFYVSAALLGLQIAFVMSFLQSPSVGWKYYLAIIASAFSIPLLTGACLAALFGYSKQLQALLITGAMFTGLWLILLFMSYSLIAGIILLLVGLISFKMLYYHYQDLKKKVNS
ncbi:MAG TPA: hypothetical protein DCE77_03095 [Methylophaga sp.]|jgi:hypothetical protein|uniref:hypothetical protein n=1 Tax=unclassified Methylophaga TaxID=2629249 RepID=UPI000C92DF05|nr:MULTISPECIES: hypothetical protein [unclassified Methylophaga]MAP26695.1 hypothetical protein [Methylophaga sp.]HAD30543.1 hypothetical protein [Methylophaga sp.]HCN98777.1 hypothetical protein [Methylophaga sp.]|tara:strand:+ start:1670 stop:2038 length:369 start_codon:yes stop_codon:yes gene_type:complete